MHAALGVTMVAGERTLSEHARSTVGVLLSIVIWMFVALPNVVQSIGAPKTRQTVGGANPPMLHVAAQLQLLLLLALCAACFLAVILSLPGVRLARGGALIAMLAPWIYLVFRDVEAGYGIGLAGLLYPLVVVAVYFLRPPLSCLKVVAHLTAITAVVSMAMAVAKPSSAIYTAPSGVEITATKQILPWGLLEGFLTQPNSLGQLLLLGVPAVLLLRSGRLQLAYLAVIGFALAWSASRSAIYSTLICLAVLAVCAVARRSSAMAARTMSALAVLGMTAVLVALPLVTSDQLAFSNRGYIWQVSLRAWAQSRWIGLGTEWYDRIASTSASLGGSVFQGHNQLVQALVIGGLVLVALMGVLLAVLAVAAVRWAGHGNLFGVVYLTALLGSCWLEVSVDFVGLSPNLGVVAFPMAVLAFAPSPHAVAAGYAAAPNPALSRA